MKDEVVITLDSCWYDLDELRAEFRRLKKKYNISVTFHNGSDHYSSMTYYGTRENIKTFLEAEYIPYFNEDEYDKEVIDFLRQ